MSLLNWKNSCRFWIINSDMIWKYFLPFCHLSLHFLEHILERIKVFSCDEAKLEHYFFFFFFGCLPLKYCHTRQGCEIFLLRILWLALMLISLTYFEQILLSGLKEESNFIILRIVTCLTLRMHPVGFTSKPILDTHVRGIYGHII